MPTDIIKNYAREFAVVAILGIIASVAGTLLGGLPVLSLFGALIIALVLGMAFQLPLRAIFVRGNEVHAKGVAKSAGWISNKLLRAGIILLGFKLNLSDLFSAGVKTIGLAIVVVAGTITMTYGIARKLHVGKHLAILTAGGTGICGAAAVMGLSSSMRLPEDRAGEQEEDEVMAVAAVAIMGTVFALIEIALRPVLGLSPTQFGTMAGASLHEIAHAVAVGGSGGSVAMDAAIIMKLSRVLMLAPAAIILGAWWAKSGVVTSKTDGSSNTEVPTAKDASSRSRAHVPLPWFMLGFIAASILGTYVPLIASWTGWLVKLAYLILGIAMAALGMNVNFSAIARRGKAAFLSSFLASVILLAFAYGAAYLLF
ncbi:MAG: putative sulfate exporter family transporter [Bifidobacteriaceae bacterium]|nr:putative sulfate exporter family transporter [Bifidobacteriaceae bacterium]